MTNLISSFKYLFREIRVELEYTMQENEEFLLYAVLFFIVLTLVGNMGNL